MKQLTKKQRNEMSDLINECMVIVADCYDGINVHAKIGWYMVAIQEITNIIKNGFYDDTYSEALSRIKSSIEHGKAYL